MRFVLLVLAAGGLTLGCQAQPSATHAGSSPKVITQLTDQTLVWNCPRCGMDYDAPGKCPMCGVDLVKTQVSYVCPVDQQPVARYGKCPRCDANAKVVRTALAEGAPTAPSTGANPPASKAGGS